MKPLTCWSDRPLTLVSPGEEDFYFDVSEAPLDFNPFASGVYPSPSVIVEFRHLFITKETFTSDVDKRPQNKPLVTTGEKEKAP